MRHENVVHLFCMTHTYISDHKSKRLHLIRKNSQVRRFDFNEFFMQLILKHDDLFSAAFRHINNSNKSKGAYNKYSTKRKEQKNVIKRKY